MKFRYIALVLIVSSFTSYGQNVGIGTSSPGAALEVYATNDGILIPRVALTGTSSASPLASPTVSTLIYNTATAGSGASAVSPGFYYWNGGAWVRFVDNNSLTGSTTNTLSLSSNTLTSTVNGVASAPSLSGLTLSGDVTGTLGASTVAGIQGKGMAITSLATNNMLQYNGANWVNVTPTAATTHTLSLSGNTLTSTVNGVAPTQSLIGLSIAGDVTGTLASSTVGKIQGAGVAITSLATNNLLQYNGSNWVNVTPASVLSGATTVSNTSSTNTLSTTVNGVTGTGVNIINTNLLGLSGTTLTSTINGVASTGLNLSSLDNNIYNSDGTLTGARTVTMGGNTLNFTGGNVGIATASPAAKLQVAGGGTQDLIVGNGGSNPQQLLIGNTGTTGGVIQAVQQGVAYNILSLNPNGGNVGIGQSSPAYKLDINGSANVNGSLYLYNNNNTATNKLFLSVGDANHYVYSTGTGGNSMYLGEYGGVYHFYNTATASDVLFINGTTINVPGLTASMGVYTDGSKNLTSTAPTSGQLGYWTRSGTNLYNTNQGDNVGIGLTGPGSKLDVNGAITTERNWIYLAGPGDLNHAVGNLLNVSGWSVDAEQFRFCQYLDLYSGCNSVDAVRILGSNGFMGIGTTTPGSRLDVAGVVNVQGAPSSGVLGTGSRIMLATGGANVTNIEENWGINLTGTATQPVKVYNASFLVGYQGGSTNYGTNNAYISGNVGIGTTTPGVKLDVYGAISVERNWLYLAGAGDGNHAIGNIAGDGEQFRYWGFFDIYAAQTGAESRFLPNGYFGVGTTSPTSILDVRGNVNLNQNTLFISGNNDNNHHIVYNGTYDGPQLAGCSGVDIYAQCFGNLAGFHHSSVFSTLGYISFWENYSSASGGYYYDVMNDLDAIDAIKPMMRKNPVTGLDMVGTRPESFPAGFTMKSSDSVPEDMVSYNKLTGLSLGGIRQLRSETKTHFEEEDARIERLEKLVSQMSGKELGQMDFTANAHAYKGVSGFVIVDARISAKSSIIIDGLSGYHIVDQEEGSFGIRFDTPPSDDVKFTYSSKY
jgi:hypothetical protein